MRPDPGRPETVIITAPERSLRWTGGIELVFETHATTEDNERGRATGWRPGRLAAQGRVRDLGLRRRDDGMAAVFSSDLARAAETVSVAFGEAGTGSGSSSSATSRPGGAWIT